MNETVNMILSIPSTARNVYQYPDPAYVRFDLSKNPIKNVKSLVMGQITVPKSEFNLVRTRSLHFKIVTTNQQFSVSLDPDFMNLQTILSKLQSAMTTNTFQINLSVNNSGKVTVQTSTEIEFFDDLPTTNKSDDIWKYVDSSFIKILGFDVTTPTTIQANTLFTCPNVVDVNGHEYVLMQVKINDTLVGNMYEVGLGGQRFGPFFGKVELNTEPGDVVFSVFNSGNHTFKNETTTISTITIEIFAPIMGGVLHRYDLNLRDWSMNLIIQKVNDLSIVTEPINTPSKMHLSINSKDRDVFERIPVFPPAAPMPTGSTVSLRNWATEPSNPSYFKIDLSKNPIKNVKAIRLGDTFIWKTTQTRTIEWSWFSDLAGIYKVENIEWYDQNDNSTLLAKLSTIMSHVDHGGKTVTWSLVNSKPTITSNEKMILFTTSPVPSGHFILSHNT